MSKKDKVINNRSEILFLYDVKDANPNGDPIDENKPRIDEETGINIVTDVRLKRTIRDYLINYKDKKDEIFVKEIIKDDGKQKTREERIEGISDKEEIVKKYIDLRLFGATITLSSKKDKNEEDKKGKSFTWTGPVQFKFGRSLHKVDLVYIKGTTVMPSKEGLAHGTFTEKYILPYSLICFYGIINENAVKNQNLFLTEADVSLMLEGMWEGTKNLISGSKFGQMPRLLMQIIYKENENYFIGELDKFISLKTSKDEKSIRDITEVKIEISKLNEALVEHKSKIEEIKIKTDEKILFLKDGKDIKDLKSGIEGLTITDFSF